MRKDMSIRVTIPTMGGNPGLADPKIGIQIRKSKKRFTKISRYPAQTAEIKNDQNSLIQLLSDAGCSKFQSNSLRHNSQDYCEITSVNEIIISLKHCE